MRSSLTNVEAQARLASVRADFNLSETRDRNTSSTKISFPYRYEVQRFPKRQKACKDEGLKLLKMSREDLRDYCLQPAGQLVTLLQVWLSYSFCFVDTCCPLGWTQLEERCFYISHTLRSLEESQKHCTSLSSKLAAVVKEPDKYYQVSMLFSISSSGCHW